ncbi:MAG TPA: aldo/keto reductase [Candidatus Limnocylindria bacterium]|jgi:aryl-alcohol dehydrogenase-like predicted oxidoreductase|nr:aldo/keto reductase [Candidatus Limnocylindria bacterium]
MDFVDIGAVRASRLGLGTWAMGTWMWGGAGDDASIATIRHALELGFTTIDTAPAHGRGHAEELVGRALVGRRDQAVIATEGGVVWDAAGNVGRDASRARLFRDVEDSLRRLRTDRIDIYFLHWHDPATPIEETGEALRDLLATGKIRAVGVNNFSPAHVEALRAVVPVHAVQLPYNLFERSGERDVLPHALRHKLGVITHGALCRGLLSGLLSGPMEERPTLVVDEVCVPGAAKRPRYGAHLRAVRRLDALARERFGKRVAHLALRWVLDQPGMGVALWRARRPDQLTRAAEALSFRLDPETLRDIDRIVRGEVRDLAPPNFVVPPEAAAV